MSNIFLASQEPHYFLTDSKGDLYEVSEEIAKRHESRDPQFVAVIDHVDTETNTIWFTSPLPKEVKANG